MQPQNPADDVTQPKFLGKSSGAHLVSSAINAKRDFTGTQSSDDAQIFFKGKRELWSLFPWEFASSQIADPHFEFPEPDLLRNLIDLYFANVNIFMPLFHQPTFRRMISQNEHLREPAFGAVLLVTCALASRYTDDPRVQLEGESSYSSGWKWFQPAQVFMRNPGRLNTSSLQILQLHCVSGFKEGLMRAKRSYSFLLVICKVKHSAGSVVLVSRSLSGSSTPHASWVMVGVKKSNSNLIVEI